MRIKHVLIIMLMLGTCAPVGVSAQTQPVRSLTLWLMPAQPPMKNAPVNGDQVQQEIAQFNKRFGEGSPVTVFNTTRPYFLSQLIAWNMEYAVPSWAMIKGQEESLDELTRFARANDVHINVRFINWGNAFNELKQAAESKKRNPGSADSLPDVAQIGSTWVAYFARNDLLMPQPSSDTDAARFRKAAGIDRASIPYSIDVRLIFYWKRNRLAPPTETEFKLRSDRWESIVGSLKERIEQGGTYPVPPMVISIGLTPDLLHNYAPMVWAGGSDFVHESVFGAEVDLKSDKALAVPRFLASNSVLKSDNLPVRPLLAFPEMSTEEATRHFLEGDYIALQKPAGFIKRWYEKFAEDISKDSSRKPGQPPACFWDYAGVAVPPVPFKGGSDLIVINGTQEKESAFALSRFLATDDAYTRILARYEGYLPAQKEKYGAEYLIASLRADSSPSVIPHSDMAAFTAQYIDYVERAVREGKEYVELDSFPTEIESHESLEAIQRLVRSIGEGSGDKPLEKIAAESQWAINRRIDNFTWSLHILWLIWPYVATVGLFILALAFRNKRRVAKLKGERAEALEQIRRIRGFASAALLSVYEIHGGYIKGNPYTSEEGPFGPKKALVVATGLQGWRRGRDDHNWIDTPLKEVVWRAIILALESTSRARLFRKWEESGEESAEAFLRSEGLLRDEPELHEGCSLFYFGVDPSADEMVPMAFMLEQALVCLLQNAIRESYDELGYHPVSITWDKASRSISVINRGNAINESLREVFNSNGDFDEFERKVDELLKSDMRSKPGIGLVEAYCIATQCYGGLEIDKKEPRVTIRLHADGRRRYEDTDYRR